VGAYSSEFSVEVSPLVREFFFPSSKFLRPKSKPEF